MRLNPKWDNHSITQNRKKHKHILRGDGYVIEKMLNAKQSQAAITAVIGCSEKTLRGEIKRGAWQRLSGKTYEYESVYSWDAAQRKHDDNGKNKGRYAKIRRYHH
jgi:IS30 family transposase